MEQPKDLETSNGEVCRSGFTSHGDKYINIVEGMFFVEDHEDAERVRKKLVQVRYE